MKMVPHTMRPPHHTHDRPLINMINGLCTDEDLVTAAQSGNNEAFAELCRRHAPPVRHRILAIVRHQEDTEDALQETLLRAYTSLGGFRQSCKFSTWITAIGINAALAVIRKRKTRREADMELEGIGESAWDVTDQAPDPERCAAKGQTILFLQKKLQTLSPKMHEVVANYYGNEYSLQEVADTLGISVAAVKSRLLRGRRSLRLSFKRKGLLDLHVW